MRSKDEVKIDDISKFKDKAHLFIATLLGKFGEIIGEMPFKVNCCSK